MPAKPASERAPADDAGHAALKIAMLPVADAGAVTERELECLPCEIWVRCTGACFLQRGMKGGPALEGTQQLLVDKCRAPCRKKGKPKLSAKERAEVIRCLAQPSCDAFGLCMYGDAGLLCSEPRAGEAAEVTE
jgi:hypothetical protein